MDVNKICFLTYRSIRNYHNTREIIIYWSETSSFHTIKVFAISEKKIAFKAHDHSITFF